MKKLLFIYNAESGMVNAMLDYGKKVFSPETYGCRLCGVTYSAFGVKNDWKKFVNQLPYESEFLHKDEFEENYDTDVTLPAVVLMEDNSHHILLSAEDFEQIHDLSTLKVRVEDALKKYS